MKKKLIFLLIVIGIITAVFFIAKNNSSTSHLGVNILHDSSLLQEGDIIFQESNSSQSEAIQLATNSKYTHCGIIFKKDDKFFVYEAIQPVTYTQLGHWIGRGAGGHYVVNRLKDANIVLTPDSKKRMLEEVKKHLGKDYDLAFEWSDDKIYCSELVWKIYQRATGIEVGDQERLKDFDLSHPVVQGKLKERYGNNVPLNEWLVSPASIFNSQLLKTVAEN